MRFLNWLKKLGKQWVENETNHWKPRIYETDKVITVCFVKREQVLQRVDINGVNRWMSHILPYEPEDWEPYKDWQRFDDEWNRDNKLVCGCFTKEKPNGDIETEKVYSSRCCQ